MAAIAPTVTSDPAFLFAPVCTGDNRSGLVSKCPPHCIPYGVFLEEYANRRPDELMDAAVSLLGRDPKAQDHALWQDVRIQRDELQRKAEWLKAAKADPNTTPEETQKLEADYRAAQEAFRGLVWGSLRTSLGYLDAAYGKLEKWKVEADISPSELDELQQQCERADRPLKLLLHRMEGHALCFSGGGIRSASFCLGVLEALARFSVGDLAPERPKDEATGLLHRLDYLSTVSGGGYIGSWLTAWVYRRCHAAVADQRHELNQAYTKLKAAQGKKDTGVIDQKQTAVYAAKLNLETAARSAYKDCFRDVIAALAGHAPTTSGDPAPGPIRHVREYTSYLAPTLGLSLDAWTLFAIVARNMLINWLMLVPLLLTFVALPQVVYFASRQFAGVVAHSAWVGWLAAVVVVAFFVWVAIFAAKNLPSHRTRATEDEAQASASEPTKLQKIEGPKLWQTTMLFILPILLANWLLVELWWSVNLEGQSAPGGPMIALGVGVLSIAGFYCLCRGIFKSDIDRLQKSSHDEQARGWPYWRRIVGCVLAGAASAALSTALAVALYGSILPALAAPPLYMGSDQYLLMIFGLPLISLVPLLSVSLLSALLGTYEMEEDREWWSRAGAVELAALAGWMAALAITLYSGVVGSGIKSAAFSAAGAAFGGLGSALGWSGKTSARPRPVKSEQMGKLGQFLQKHDLTLPVICAVALLLLIIGAANGEVLLAEALLPWTNSERLAHFIAFAGAFALAFIVNRAISINLFSLNGMYRMRLMRAFMGASNVRRHADQFTGFDPRDTPIERYLPTAPGAPLHLINTTLNLVGTKNTAWRQRMAEPFSFSPLHSGSWRVGYVPTRYYAGADGPTLATAMTISGAAFNPNMGYHSSPLVTLMMTLFNVRLGWWLPNPSREEGARGPLKIFSQTGADFLRRNGPSLALEPLILEAFGQTDDTYRWIELTDGGHFENLGLYEMVMRRCKKIIVADAGADPKCQFEDLGNALRKIQIDLGIPIRLRNLLMNEGAKETNRYCAVADIDYGCVDAGPDLSPEDARGTLIYIKAAITGNEPPDVKQYSLTHGDFPHESTANQFFNEAQFESYRHLASFAVEKIATAGIHSRESANDSMRGESPKKLSCASGETGREPQFDFDAFAKAATAHSVGG